MLHVKGAATEASKVFLGSQTGVCLTGRLISGYQTLVRSVAKYIASHSKQIPNYLPRANTIDGLPANRADVFLKAARGTVHSLQLQDIVMGGRWRN